MDAGKDECEEGGKGGKDSGSPEKEGGKEERAFEKALRATSLTKGVVEDILRHTRDAAMKRNSLSVMSTPASSPSSSASSLSSSLLSAHSTTGSSTTFSTSSSSASAASSFRRRTAVGMSVRGGR
eukprot:evm.model.NODE_23057_length_1141_cov_10.632778.1